MSIDRAAICGNPVCAHPYFAHMGMGTCIHHYCHPDERRKKKPRYHEGAVCPCRAFVPQEVEK